MQSAWLSFKESLFNSRFQRAAEAEQSAAQGGRWAGKRRVTEGKREKEERRSTKRKNDVDLL